MPTCCTPGCYNSSLVPVTDKHGHKVTFHSFPKQAKFHQQWLDNLNIRNFELNSKSRVCSIHFKEKFVNRNKTRVRLSYRAVPTLFLQTNKKKKKNRHGSSSVGNKSRPDSSTIPVSGYQSGSNKVPSGTIPVLATDENPRNVSSLLKKPVTPLGRPTKGTLKTTSTDSTEIEDCNSKCVSLAVKNVDGSIESFSVALDPSSEFTKKQKSTQKQENSTKPETQTSLKLPGNLSDLLHIKNCSSNITFVPITEHPMEITSTSKAFASRLVNGTNVSISTATIKSKDLRTTPVFVQNSYPTTGVRVTKIAIPRTSSSNVINFTNPVSLDNKKRTVLYVGDKILHSKQELNSNQVDGSSLYKIINLRPVPKFPDNKANSQTLDSIQPNVSSACNVLSSKTDKFLSFRKPSCVVDTVQTSVTSDPIATVTKEMIQDETNSQVRIDSSITSTNNAEIVKTSLSHGPKIQANKSSVENSDKFTSQIPPKTNPKSPVDILMRPKISASEFNAVLQEMGSRNRMIVDKNLLTETPTTKHPMPQHKLPVQNTEAKIVKRVMKAAQRKNAGSVLESSVPMKSTLASSQKEASSSTVRSSAPMQSSSTLSNERTSCTSNAPMPNNNCSQDKINTNAPSSRSVAKNSSSMNAANSPKERKSKPQSVNVTKTPNKSKTKPTRKNSCKESCTENCSLLHQRMNIRGFGQQKIFDKTVHNKVNSQLSRENKKDAELKDSIEEVVIKKEVLSDQEDLVLDHLNKEECEAIKSLAKANLSHVPGSGKKKITSKIKLIPMVRSQSDSCLYKIQRHDLFASFDGAIPKDEVRTFDCKPQLRRAYSDSSLNDSRYSRKQAKVVVNLLCKKRKIQVKASKQSETSNMSINNGEKRKRTNSEGSGCSVSPSLTSNSSESSSSSSSSNIGKNIATIDVRVTKKDMKLLDLKRKLKINLYMNDPEIEKYYEKIKQSRGKLKKGCKPSRKPVNKVIPTHFTRRTALKLGIFPSKNLEPPTSSRKSSPRGSKSTNKKSDNLDEMSSTNSSLDSSFINENSDQILQNPSILIENPKKCTEVKSLQNQQINPDPLKKVAKVPNLSSQTKVSVCLKTQEESHCKSLLEVSKTVGNDSCSRSPTDVPTKRTKIQDEALHLKTIPVLQKLDHQSVQKKKKRHLTPKIMANIEELSKNKVELRKRRKSVCFGVDQVFPHTQLSNAAIVLPPPKSLKSILKPFDAQTIAKSRQEIKPKHKRRKKKQKKVLVLKSEHLRKYVETIQAPITSEDSLGLTSELDLDSDLFTEIKTENAEDKICAIASVRSVSLEEHIANEAPNYEESLENVNTTDTFYVVPQNLEIMQESLVLTAQTVENLQLTDLQMETSNQITTNSEFCAAPLATMETSQNLRENIEAGVSILDDASGKTIVFSEVNESQKNEDVDPKVPNKSPVKLNLVPKSLNTSCSQKSKLNATSMSIVDQYLTEDSNKSKMVDNQDTVEFETVEVDILKHLTVADQIPNENVVTNEKEQCIDTYIEIEVDNKNTTQDEKDVGPEMREDAVVQDKTGKTTISAAQKVRKSFRMNKGDRFKKQVDVIPHLPPEEATHTVDDPQTSFFNSLQLLQRDQQPGITVTDSQPSTSRAFSPQPSTSRDTSTSQRTPFVIGDKRSLSSDSSDLVDLVTPQKKRKLSPAKKSAMTKGDKSEVESEILTQSKVPTPVAKYHSIDSELVENLEMYLIINAKKLGHEFHLDKTKFAHHFRQVTSPTTALNIYIFAEHSKQTEEMNQLALSNHFFKALALHKKLAEKTIQTSSEINEETIYLVYSDMGIFLEDKIYTVPIPNCDFCEALNPNIPLQQIYNIKETEIQKMLCNTLNLSKSSTEQFLKQFTFGINQPSLLKLIELIKNELTIMFNCKINECTNLYENLKTFVQSTHVNTKYFNVFFESCKNNIKRIIMTPHNVSQHFYNRSLELKMLNNAIVNHGDTKAQIDVALTGPPGVGKTEIVLKYIELNSMKFDHIFWFDGKKLIENYINLCFKLNLFNSNDRNIHLPTLVEKFYKLLENSRCLFIYDDVSQIKDVKRTLPDNVNKNHFVILTSQYTEWDCKTQIPVDVFSLSDSEEFLKLQLPKIDGSDLFKIAELFGYLPYGLQIAIFCIKRQEKLWKFKLNLNDSWCINDFYDTYKNNINTILDYIPQKNEEINYTKPLSKLWNLETIDNSKLAIKLLNLLSFANNSKIPSNMLEKINIEAIDTYYDALLELESFSFIKCENKRIIIQPILQIILRNVNPNHETALSELLELLNLDIHDCKFKTPEFGIHAIQIWTHCTKFRQLQVKWYNVLMAIVNLEIISDEKMEKFIENEHEVIETIINKNDIEMYLKIQCKYLQLLYKTNNFIKIIKIVDKIVNKIKPIVYSKSMLKILYYKAQSLYELNKLVEAWELFEKIFLEENENITENDCVIINNWSVLTAMVKTACELSNDEALQMCILLITNRCVDPRINHNRANWFINDITQVLIKENKQNEAVELYNGIYRLQCDMCGKSNITSYTTLFNTAKLLYVLNKLDQCWDILRLLHDIDVKDENLKENILQLMFDTAYQSSINGNNCKLLTLEVILQDCAKKANCTLENILLNILNEGKNKNIVLMTLYKDAVINMCTRYGPHHEISMYTLLCKAQFLRRNLKLKETWSLLYGLFDNRQFLTLHENILPKALSLITDLACEMDALLECNEYLKKVQEIYVQILSSSCKSQKVIASNAYLIAIHFGITDRIDEGIKVFDDLIKLTKAKSVLQFNCYKALFWLHFDQCQLATNIYEDICKRWNITELSGSENKLQLKRMVQTVLDLSML